MILLNYMNTWREPTSSQEPNKAVEAGGVQIGSPSPCSCEGEGVSSVSMILSMNKVLVPTLIP